eukprot:7241957-Prymnesium_polylepis.1
MSLTDDNIDVLLDEASHAYALVNKSTSSAEGAAGAGGVGAARAAAALGGSRPFDNARASAKLAPMLLHHPAAHHRLGGVVT